MIWYAADLISLLFKFVPTPLVRIMFRCCDIFDGNGGALLRYIIVKRKLAGCGSKVYIGPWVYIDLLNKVTLGSGVSIHQRCNILAGGGVSIGDDVAIAHDSTLVSGNHTWADQGSVIKRNPVLLAPIVIESDVWIGCGVRVLAGVVIKSRCIVAAGSIVTRQLDSGSLYAGIPAKKMKDL